MENLNNYWKIVVLVHFFYLCNPFQKFLRRRVFKPWSFCRRQYTSKSYSVLTDYITEQSMVNTCESASGCRCVEMSSPTASSDGEVCEVFKVNTTPTTQRMFTVTTILTPTLCHSYTSLFTVITKQY